eukprot:2383652-Alexandrium_andersonii.AAC.1
MGGRRVDRGPWLFVGEENSAARSWRSWDILVKVMRVHIAANTSSRGIARSVVACCVDCCVTLRRCGL